MGAETGDGRGAEMNLPRLRELVKAWQDGSIRVDELTELRDALPEVFDQTEKLKREWRELMLFRAQYYEMMAHAP